jgi:ribosome-binding factor A
LTVLSQVPFARSRQVSSMPRTSSKLSPTHRIERVGELIRQALAEILARGDILDPALDGRPVTIPAVRMSPDLRVAGVSVMPLGGQNGEATVEALNRHKKELRGLIAHRVNLRFAPDLRFALDASFDAQARIDALLKSPKVARDLGSHEIEDTDET